MESSDFAHEMSLASGQRFFEKLASTGGTCDTYRVRINGKWHFLKRPKGEMSSNPLYITAFEREFDIGYRLEHKSLVRYIDKRIDEQGVYILTEMVDGDNLDEFVSKNSDYFKDKRKLKEFVTQMLDVLDYLHNNQVLHLDLTPSNIMITRVGHKVKLVDLGFAYSDCYQSIAAGMTREYAAPEQLHGGEVGPWTDIYALGKVLLALFNNDERMGGFRAVPSCCRSFVKKCVETDPQLRFATVAQARQFLSKKQSNHTLIAGILISIAMLLMLIVWGINHIGGKEDPHIANETSAVPHNRIDSIEINAGVDSASQMKKRNDTQPINNPSAPHNRQEQETGISTKKHKGAAAEHNEAASDLKEGNNELTPQKEQKRQQASVDPKGSLPGGEQIKAIAVPEALKSQLHERAKAAFTALERKYAVVDNYKTRADLMIEIKNARAQILEYATAQATDNEGKEKYYNTALEILNQEYERSNLPGLTTSHKP